MNKPKFKLTDKAGSEVFAKGFQIFNGNKYYEIIEGDKIVLRHEVHFVKVENYEKVDNT